MSVRCPECRAIVPLAKAEFGRAGRMVRCARCGTRWLARSYAGDPYAAAVTTPSADDEVADAIVIDDSPAPIAVAAYRHEPHAARRGLADGRLGILGAALAIVVTLGIFYAPIVAALPIGQLPQDVASLEFRQIRSETVEIGGASTLFVEGEVVNRSGRQVDLPAIRITLKAPAGHDVTSWLVEPTARTVEAGRAIGFRSALADPPRGATQVTLNLAVREGKGILPLE